MYMPKRERITNGMIREPASEELVRVIRGWKQLAKHDGWTFSTLCAVGEYQIPVIENEASRCGEPGGLYLSAGVHGDECAPPWALLQWVEEKVLAGSLQEPCLIFPCLNPYGLVHNLRTNEEGIDLNRCFQEESQPVVGAWQRHLEGKRFSMALSLHEDYDSCGVYLYELVAGDSIGEQLLSECEGVLPRETAAEVDGSEFENGLLSHTGDLDDLVEEQLGGGYPEAIYLFQHFSRDSFTFETPSENDLKLRIASQKAFLSAAYAAYQKEASS